ncbi:MAG: histidinol-phosphatase HisJ family protein [Alphaproteobacteria bacterium]|nr:histidinol-phosphatase HisJ family protein [Alphaproteobacteria bacterium]
MKQNFSYHTHTLFSDGKNTIDEMLEQAVKIGFKQIGISDHLIVHKNLTKMPSYCETTVGFDDFKTAREACARHAEQIRKAAKKYPLKVYVGYEVDYFTYNGWEDEFRDLAKKIDYDYFISGNHFFMSENGEDIFDIWRYDDHPNTAPEEISVYLRRHFQTMRQAVQSKMFFFLAHLDYAQKIKDYRQNDYVKEINDVLKMLCKTKTGCEISTKGLRRYGHFFPSKDIIKALIKQNIPLVISDDAHHIDELGSFFDKAEETLAALGASCRLKRQTGSPHINH